MGLFKSGEFILPSGYRSDWTIDCNALTNEDMETLALMASKILPPFGTVVPTMRGGVRFSTALTKHCQEGGRLLVAEDVLTTGNSMEEMRDGRDALGITIFARGDPPPWVTALWSLT